MSGPCRRRSRGWAGRVCCLQPGPARLRPPLTCCPFSRGQGSGRLWAELRGSLLSRKPTCPGGQPQTTGKLWGADWSGSTSPGLPGWGLERGGGLPWKG